MKQKHTPAPWYIIESKHDYGISYHISDRPKDLMQGLRVCQTENKPNANLIAAAPELLGALEEVADSVGASGNITVSYDTLYKAIKAIDKAKGQV